MYLDSSSSPPPPSQEGGGLGWGSRGGQDARARLCPPSQPSPHAEGKEYKNRCPCREAVMQIAEAARLSRTVLEALQQVIVGKEQVLQHLLLGLYSGGNILIEDFPGLAKTL